MITIVQGAIRWHNLKMGYYRSYSIWPVWICWYIQAVRVWRYTSLSLARSESGFSSHIICQTSCNCISLSDTAYHLFLSVAANSFQEILGSNMLPDGIFDLSLVSFWSSHPLQTGSRTDVFRFFQNTTCRWTRRECCIFASSVAGNLSGSIFPFAACYRNF